MIEGGKVPTGYKKRSINTKRLSPLIRISAPMTVNPILTRNPIPIRKREYSPNLSFLSSTSSTMFGKLEAAEKAMDAAEEYFKHQNLDMAIRAIKAAKEFNPDLPGTNELYAAYMVHKIIAMKKGYYAVLGITDRSVDTSTIKNHYKTMALALHPDKNKSVAAESAFKILNEAWQILSDPNKRRIYDMGFKAKKRASTRTPPSTTKSSSCPSSASSSRTGYAAPNPNPKRRVFVRFKVDSSSSSRNQASHDSSRTGYNAELPLRRFKAFSCVCHVN